MNCPLLMQPLLKYSKAMALDEAECLEGKCAWWDKGFNRCVMLGYLHELANLADTLAEIRDRLPSHSRLV